MQNGQREDKLCAVALPAVYKQMVNGSNKITCLHEFDGYFLAFQQVYK